MLGTFGPPNKPARDDVLRFHQRPVAFWPKHPVGGQKIFFGCQKLNAKDLPPFRVGSKEKQNPGQSTKHYARAPFKS